MSFVTTARLYFGQSRRLNRSTSAVFPEPTGPAIPTRNARVESCLRIFPPAAGARLAASSPPLCAAVYQLAKKIASKLPIEDGHNSGAQNRNLDWAALLR